VGGSLSRVAKAGAAAPGCQPSRAPRHEVLALQHCATSSSTSAFTRKDELHGASGGGRGVGLVDPRVGVAPPTG
jgi:hypothetical protein